MIKHILAAILLQTHDELTLHHHSLCQYSGPAFSHVLRECPANRANHCAAVTGKPWR